MAKAEFTMRIPKGGTGPQPGKYYALADPHLATSLYQCIMVEPEVYRLFSVENGDIWSNESCFGNTGELRFTLLPKGSNINIEV